MIKELRGVPILILQILFTISYTLTVLPYTVKFFEGVASLPSMGVQLFGIVYLSEAQRLAIPCFLAFLEFSSVFIACFFWSEKKKFILILFLVCQLIPVVSTYHEIQSKNYTTQRELLENTKVENIRVKKEEIEGVKQSIANKQKQIQEVEQAGVNRFNHVRNQIAGELQNARTNEYDEETYRREASTLMRERKNLSKKEDELNNKIEAQRSEMKDIEDKQQELQKALFLYTQAVPEGLENSEWDYIAKKFFARNSGLAMFVSFIFPITIMGFSFWITKLKDRGDTRSVLHLQQHLEYASALPQELHLEYVRGLLPSVSAHVAVIKASGEIANNNLGLNLQYSLTRRILSDLESLKKQIVCSNLKVEAKNYLSSAVEKVTDKQIFSNKEGKGYV